MPHSFPTKLVCSSLLLVGAVSASICTARAEAQESGQFVEPVYRVAHEEPAEQAPQMAARINPPAKQTPLDLTQRPGEHPLMPALRVAKQALDNIDANIKDYSALLYKQERINGELGELELSYIKVRHQPFSVYMYFLQPNKGRECLYNHPLDGTKGKLVAMDCGWKRRFGKVELDPEGSLAMKGQKYPITKLGLRNLTSELIDVATNDVQFGECEVHTYQRAINGRPATLLEVVHPVPRQNFRFHKAEVFIDNELLLPVRYAAYMWPAAPGQDPPLEESYTYVDLKLNNGFTNADFDQNNPEYFKN
jgi:Protein of unknown function (DUF1571)